MPDFLQMKKMQSKCESRLKNVNQNAIKKMIRTPKEIIREFEELREQLPKLVKNSGYKDKFIYEKMGMEKSLFYRRMTKLELWTLDEMKQLFEVIC